MFEIFNVIPKTRNFQYEIILDYFHENRASLQLR